MLDHLLKLHQTKEFNCASLVVAAWKELTGGDVSFMRDAHGSSSMRGSLTKINHPRNPCIVLMFGKKITPHAGVWVDGGLLHLSSFGPAFQSLRLATLGYSKVRFYVP